MVAGAYPRVGRWLGSWAGLMGAGGALGRRAVLPVRADSVRARSLGVGEAGRKIRRGYPHARA